MQATEKDKKVRDPDKSNQSTSFYSTFQKFNRALGQKTRDLMNYKDHLDSISLINLLQHEYLQHLAVWKQPALRIGK